MYFRLFMDIHKYIKNGMLSVRVTPHATQVKIVEESGSLKVYLKSVPEKDKANAELIKFLKQEFHLRVRIKFGLKNREKVLEVVG